jgi:lincosamide nucleotidyltransferase A/C/D/E
MMPAHEVLRVMEKLGESGVSAWLDGGWGVDALLERQTRDHEDLDLVIELRQADAARQALRELAYEMTLDERPTRLVVRSSDGREIDLHTVVLDEDGGGVQHLQNGRSYRYPPEGFARRGKIAGRLLSCLTPEVQLECHTGYDPTDTDRHDVNMLVERFRLPPPKGY